MQGGFGSHVHVFGQRQEKKVLQNPKIHLSAYFMKLPKVLQATTLPFSGHVQHIIYRKPLI